MDNKVLIDATRLLTMENTLASLAIVHPFKAPEEYPPHRSGNQILHARLADWHSDWHSDWRTNLK
jgi:hypothetical protein